MSHLPPGLRTCDARPTPTAPAYAISSSRMHVQNTFFTPTLTLKVRTPSCRRQLTLNKPARRMQDAGFRQAQEYMKHPCRYKRDCPVSSLTCILPPVRGDLRYSAYLSIPLHIGDVLEEGDDH